MIIKGGAAGNVSWWGSHLTRDDTNTRAELVETRGLLAESVPGALREMQAVAAGSRSQGNFMYQANINPREGETLTPEQWQEAVDTLEKNLGLEGHQRIVVEHEKEGRTHRHVVWNRVDVDTLRVADITGNYRNHERTARELEARFGLTPTPTPAKTAEQTREPSPELWELRAQERSGIKRDELKDELTGLYRTTDSGAAFRAAIEERGYILAQGNRRDFVILDHAGDVHSLARRIEGTKAADIRARFADIDRASLPTVEEARAIQREAYPTKDEAREGWLGRAEPQPYPIQSAFSVALEGAETGEQLRDRLAASGLSLTRATSDDVAEIREAYLRDDSLILDGRSAAHLRIASGDLVALDGAGAFERLDPRRIDLARVESLLAADGLPPALAGVMDTRRAIHDAGLAEFCEGFPGSTETSLDISHKPAADLPGDRGERLGDPVTGAARGAFMVMDAFANSALKLFDFVDALLGGGSKEPPPPPSAWEQAQANRWAIAALERIHDSIKNEQPIAAGDIRSLTPAHLEGIRSSGDEYLRTLLSRMEDDNRREREREDWGRAREL